MPIDFDTLVLEPCQDTFGEPVQYDSGYSGVFSVSGIFDKAYEEVTVQDGEPVSEKCPVLSVRTSQCPFYPKQGDSLTVRGEKYDVREVRDDSHGSIKLMLNGPLSA